MNRLRGVIALIAAMAAGLLGQAPSDPAPAAPNSAVASSPAKPTNSAAVSKPGSMAKPLVAVMSFEARQVGLDEAQILGEAVAAELTKSGEVRLMERSQMDKILSEQGFQKSGACSGTDCAVEVGQILGIDRMVVGSVGHIGKTYVVSARMVNVATGEVVKSSSRQAQGEIDQILTTLAPQVALELLGKSLEMKPVNVAPTAQFSAPPPSEVWSDSMMVVWQASDDKALAAIHFTIARSDKPDSVLVKDMKPVRGLLANGSTMLRFPATLDSGTYILKVAAEDNEKASGSSQVYFQRKFRIKESNSHWGWWLFAGLLLTGGGGGAAWYLTQKNDQNNNSNNGSNNGRSFEVTWN